jgi:simple sugar transport system permease protein
MVFMLQGLIVLFAGAMAQVAAPALLKVYRAFGGGQVVDTRHG